MQKLLLRRTLRDLKDNFFRYFSLFCLIILAMFLIISLIGAAESVIGTVNKRAAENNLEDGQFAVFLPLTDKQISNLEDEGILLEESFYIDFAATDNSTIRVMKMREKINMIEISKGRLPEKENEIAIERIYATAHNLSVDDTIEIAGKAFKITAIITSPDYDSCLQNISDMASDGKIFGTAFVSNAAYRSLLETGKALHSEEYRYSYKRKNSSALEDNELKEKLLDFKINADDVDDPYFTEEINEKLEDRNDVTDGISSLVDASVELCDALEEIDSGSISLKNGMQLIYDGLAELNKQTSNLTTASSRLLSSLQSIDGAIASQYFEFDTSLNSYANAVSSLYNGYSSLMEGATDLTDGTKELSSHGKEFRDGVEELEEESNTLLNDYFSLKIGNLTNFIKAEDNPRIKAANADVEINISVGMIAGIIILVLITYVISIFIIHSIDQESAMIGALYALGLKRQELLSHYTMLPVLLCFTGGTIGTILGYSKFGISYMTSDSYSYFSIPDVVTIYSPYLLVYGIFVPPLIAFIVNRIIIKKRLNKTALSLLRKEQSIKNIKTRQIKSNSFIRIFQIRQFLREKRSCIAVLAAIFVSLLILMLGLNCYVLCSNIKVKNIADTKYTYMYQYKYPTDFPPDGGTEAYIEGLKKENLGYDMEISIIGLTKTNPYFPAIKSKTKSEISISTSVASKYNLKVGEELILRDEVNEKFYGFTVKEIIPYSTGLCCFMDIDNMRELFDREEDYYNIVYSTKELDIDSGRLYSVSKKADVEKSASIFLTLMMPMFIMMTVVSILIFLIVLYQMMKVMIDRSSFSISLMKIFGYKDKEIRKLYLDGNFLLIAVSSLILIPLSKLFMDSIYPIFIANVACGIELTWPIWLYLAVYIGILVSYFMIQILLMRKIAKLTATEVLKDRE